MNSLPRLVKLSNASISSITRNASTLQTFRNHLKEQLESIKVAGTFKNERVIITKQGNSFDFLLLSFKH
jgi:hypothetical protein